ncbi:hypothetical protein SAMN05216548_11810 [Faunimonas pinastri]|uniref:Uncharacterized protein n=1 Tax=Faunimonas pinastri TaxID=1855383 RepID=A0A1H9P0P8_9HYPH|nr:hypothetical protein SAMN05216548_11810 [Faunimonas pinastri]
MDLEDHAAIERRFTTGRHDAFGTGKVAGDEGKPRRRLDA